MQTFVVSHHSAFRRDLERRKQAGLQMQFTKHRLVESSGGTRPLTAWQGLHKSCADWFMNPSQGSYDWIVGVVISGSLHPVGAMEHLSQELSQFR